MSSPPGTPPVRPPAGPAWASRGYADQVRAAMDEARRVAPGRGTDGDVPIGALVLDADGAVLGRGHNVREEHADPAGHAEIVALRQAGAARGSWRLAGCTLVVTLEPCTMCAGAIVLARVARVVIGAPDPKAGAAGSLYDLLQEPRLNHRAQVDSGVREQECGDLLREFFRSRRSR